MVELQKHILRIVELFGSPFVSASLRDGSWTHPVEVGARVCSIEILCPQDKLWGELFVLFVE